MSGCGTRVKGYKQTMVLNRTFLTALLLCYPFMAFGVDVSALKNTMSGKKNINEVISAYQSATEQLLNDEKYKDKVDAEAQKEIIDQNIQKAQTENVSADDVDDVDDAAAAGNGKTQEEKQQALEDKKKKYEDAKANEQSTANKTLTALTTAATGIGGMELAQGLSEQKADKEADANMDAYLETFACSYGEGKRVKAGPEEIELPGGNDAELMKLRAEYIALAADLKERKTALGMKPGIESEEILDKATMGLYDDENVGINGGAYASLYRAKMLGSEEDQSKIDAERKSSKNRVIAGGVLAGAGVVGGIIGNSAINGKLAEKIKEAKAKKEIGAETEKALKIESDALENLQKCLKQAGVNNTDSLSFSNFYVSTLSVKNINCKKDMTNVSGKYANDLFVDSADTSEFLNKMIESFGPAITSKMIGTSLTAPEPTEEEKTKAKNVLDRGQEAAKKRIEDAQAKDEQASSSSKDGILSGLSSSLGGGLGNAASGLLGNGGDGASGGLGNLLGK